MWDIRKNLLFYAESCKLYAIIGINEIYTEAGGS